MILSSVTSLMWMAERFTLGKTLIGKPLTSIIGASTDATQFLVMLSFYRPTNDVEWYDPSVNLIRYFATSKFAHLYETDHHNAGWKIGDHDEGSTKS